MRSSIFALALLSATSLAAAGCASATPSAGTAPEFGGPAGLDDGGPRTTPWGAHLGGGAAAGVQTASAAGDPSESQRRAWVERNFGSPQVVKSSGPTIVGEPPGSDGERRRVVVRDRVHVVREPYHAVPPVHLSLGWSHYGGRRHHSGFGYGIGWNWPLCW